MNGSIHGDEYVGTDAVLQLVEHFALEDDETTKNILDNTILVGKYEDFKQNVNELVANGSRFIAVGKGASEVAMTLELTDVSIHGSSSNYSIAIVHVQNNKDNFMQII